MSVAAAAAAARLRAGAGARRAALLRPCAAPGHMRGQRAVRVVAKAFPESNAKGALQPDSAGGASPRPGGAADVGAAVHEQVRGDIALAQQACTVTGGNLDECADAWERLEGDLTLLAALKAEDEVVEDEEEDAARESGSMAGGSTAAALAASTMSGTGRTAGGGGGRLSTIGERMDRVSRQRQAMMLKREAALESYRRKIRDVGAADLTRESEQADVTFTGLLLLAFVGPAIYIFCAAATAGVIDLSAFGWVPSPAELPQG